MFPCSDRPFCNPCFKSHFWRGKVGFDAFQQEVIACCFGVDGNELSGAKSLLEMVEFDMHRAVCKSQQLTQRRVHRWLSHSPDLALAVLRAVAQLWNVRRR